MIVKTHSRGRRTARGAVAVLAILCHLPLPAMAQGIDQLLIATPPPPAQAQPGAAPQQAPQQTPQSRRDQAFEKAIRETLPMTPGQIQTYRKGLDDTRRSITTPMAHGKPVSRAVRLTLKPGEETPVLRVQPGIVSTMTFSDVTGQPWPVLSVTTGNPQAYVAQSAGEEGKSNIIVVNAIQEWTPGNLAVTLVGHPVPVILAIRQGEPETDYRVDIRVEARGPNAAQDIVGTSSLAPTNDSSMIKFLDGTPPQGSRRLQTTSPDVEAWRYEDMLYVRTRGDILSPAYTARSSNVSGVNVFTMIDAPIVIVSAGGRALHVRIGR